MKFTIVNFLDFSTRVVIPQRTSLKHNELWKGSADKEGNLDVKIREGIIEDEVPRQYLAQHYWEGYKNLKTN